MPVRISEVAKQLELRIGVPVTSDDDSVTIDDTLTILRRGLSDYPVDRWVALLSPMFEEYARQYKENPNAPK